MLPEPAEPADDLVGDQQDVVPAQHLLDRGRSTAGGGTMTPPAPMDRLGDEGGDRVGALALDQRLELRGERGRELLLGLPGAGVPVVVRGAGVEHHRERQVEGPVERREAGQRLAAASP